ncbi:hypothetical protein WICMUC_001424 [Wickerhamomyces mucosus]|uniref:Uncharacterized protein n=1 Tax=Wickerhamomyces mucosus TaxID=1378264 RepID=A0A9P8PU28_9ASCO|nr:hypothetical protein WICMUC_001424 [Wickerhamomyces mucosus]
MVVKVVVLERSSSQSLSKGFVPKELFVILLEIFGKELECNEPPIEWCGMLWVLWIDVPKNDGSLVRDTDLSNFKVFVFFSGCSKWLSKDSESSKIAERFGKSDDWRS